MKSETRDLSGPQFQTSNLGIQNFCSFRPVWSDNNASDSPDGAMSTIGRIVFYSSRVPNTGRLMNAKTTTWILLAIFTLIGCTTRPPFMTNADPALRQSSAQFAADAAHRVYETSAMQAGPANGRAEIDYGIRRLSIVNSSNEDWTNVEIWLNKQYVVLLPKVQANAAQMEEISLDYIFDQHGKYFPENSEENPINSVEMFKDGKMYTLGLQLAD
jgi:hypothetical protein